MSSRFPEVSLVVVPRERASAARASLRSMLRGTNRPFELIYVDCLLPEEERRSVRATVEAHGGRFLRSDEFLYPNQARNRGLEHAEGDFVVFVDNDLFVEPGWLDALVRCARETGAGVVGPLYLEGDPDAPLIHGAGGMIRRTEGPDGGTRLVARQHDLGVPLADAGPMERTETDLVEFHCVLVNRDCLRAIGGRLDDELRTTREHVDLCMMASQTGHAVYLEPESRVRYGNTEPLRPDDLPYLLFRWSDDATRRTILRFEEKWDVRLGDRHRRIVRNRRWQAVCLAWWPFPREWFMALRSAARRMVRTLRPADEPA